MDEKKIKVLWYGDTPAVQTGFGRVARELLNRLRETGKYEIVCLGLNDRGEPHPIREKFKIIPCPDLKEDPYGFRMLGQVINMENPDILLTLNDIWVYTGFEENGNKDWFRQTIQNTKANLPVVCYFTIDGKPNAPEWDEFIRWVTVPVVMSDYGEQTVLETAPDVEENLMKAYHGSGVEYFKPVEDEARSVARKKLMGNKPIDDNTFIIGVVSRNQPRKNLPTLLHAFKKYVSGYWKCPKCGYYLSDVDSYCEICWKPASEIKNEVEKVEGNENAYLYLHMSLRDGRGYKLDKIIRDNRIPNIIANPRHNVAQGVPIEQLNLIYNAFDVLCQPTFAEGYGLPPIEASAAGVPTIATHTTTMAEMFKDGRGELVLADSVYVLADAGQCRKHNISESGLIAAFDKLYKNPELRKEYGQKAREFALSRTWDMAAEVIDEAVQKAHSQTFDVYDLFEKDTNKKFLIINTTPNPEDVVNMIPAIRAIYKNENKPQIVCLVRDSFSNILNGLEFIRASKGIRYSSLNQKKLAEGGVSVINLSGIWENFSVAMFPNITAGAKEAFCAKLGLNCEKGIKFGMTDEERMFAKNFLKEHNDKLKIFVATAGVEENVYDFFKWSKVIKHLAQMKNAAIFTDLVKRPFEEDIEGVHFLGGITDIKQHLSIAKYCDILVTCDNIFLMLSNKFNGYTVAIAAGSDIKNKYDLDDCSTIANDNGSFPCWPCNRVPGIQCLKTGKKGIAACIQTIQPAEIVSLVMKAKKEIGA